jgi:hypothetical protein
MEGIRVREWASGRLVVGLIAGLTGVVAGCTDKVDPKFAADTYDEYTEPLADAVIGTPEGTTVIGPAGQTTFVPAALAAGSPRPGAGGRSGAGGSIATGGSIGADGGMGFGGSFGADGGVATGGAGVARRKRDRGAPRGGRVSWPGGKYRRGGV